MYHANILVSTFTVTKEQKQYCWGLPFYTFAIRLAVDVKGICVFHSAEFHSVVTFVQSLTTLV